MKINPVEYDREGRMKYHPDYHSKHQKPWSRRDEKYLIENYEIDGPDTISFILERTIGVVMTRVYQLRKEGKMPRRSPDAKNHPRGKKALKL